jgi:hypothetical protein
MEHDPAAVMDGVVLALVVAATLNEVPTIALAGAPVKVTVGVALLTVMLVLVVELV